MDGMYRSFLVMLLSSANPSVATSAFILARNLVPTGRGQITGLAICGKKPSYPIQLVVMCYFSSGEIQLRQNMARHKADSCTNKPHQAEEAT